AADGRIRGVRTVSYGDGASEMALANSLGVEATARRTVCSVSALTLAGEGVGTRTGYGFSVGREPSELDVEEAAQMAAERAVRLIENGRLARFLHNVHTGRRSGSGTTGSAVRAGYTSTPGVGARALHFEPGSAPPEELLRRAEGGLFVQSITGQGSGASPVTGDFSVGADGLIIRDGALAEPVREVTVASTFQRMLLDLEVGNDLQWLPGGAAGITILVPEMAMSGS
ncbi:MAG TPA: metallopeptidase TldD-related protein, partial [Acidimicrobiia bacterium]|nr:metallopeptidase TldD-related protein [Acidimicrobiia bacterium]